MVSLSTIKIIGLASLMSYAAARLLVATGWLGWHRQHLVLIRRARLPALPRGFDWRLLSPEDVAGLAIDVGPDAQADRFAAGFACIGLFTAKGALAGVVWMGRARAREADYALEFILPAHAAWDTGMWVHPDHRAGRAFAALWAAIGLWMDRHGIDASYSLIADYNGASLAAHRRLGMEMLATLLIVRAGHWQWIARGADRWRLARAARPLRWDLPAGAAPAAGQALSV